MTISKYLPLVFLLFFVQLTFASTSTIHADRDDRCELKGFFGVTHDEPSQEKLASLGYEAKGGTIVTNVIGCSAAVKAGIQPMDYLFEVNGKATSTSRSFFCLLADIKEGESFQVGFLRMGKKKTVTAMLGRRSDACQGEHPFPKNGFFGIHDTESDSKPGTLIDVSSDGPVAMMGLQDGDRLLRINGYAIADWSDLSIVKRLISDTDNVTFEVIRDGQDFSFSGAIPEQEHNAHNWTINRITLADCVEDLDDVKKDLENSLGELEREIESALASRDIRGETSEAVEDVMAAIREVFGRSSSGGTSDDFSSDINPRDMDAKIEEMSESDFSAMEDLVSDMPKNRNLAVNNFSASPNPNEGRFRLTFELPSAGDTRIAIYSASGREIYGYELGEFTGLFTDELDIMRNGPGTYFLVVRQEDKAFVRKIILIKR